MSELEALKKEFEAFKTGTLAELHTLQKNQSSRRGLDGVRGEKGDPGNPGRDATVKITTENGKIIVLSGDGQRAEIVTVPGKDGRDGATGAPCNHPAPQNGKDGKDAPSLDEIVQAVLENLKTRFARLFS